MADQAPPPFNVDNGSPTAVCAECGNTFNQGDLIRHGNVFICANCKPVFMQKLAEGARIDGGALRYGGGLPRAVAYIIDLIILYIVNQIITRSFGLTPPPPTPGQPPNLGLLLSAMVPVLLVSSLVGISYETFFIGKFAATPGKMIFKLRVVTADGGRVSYLRAFGRYFAKIVSAIILYIGFLMAFFDDEKRALHDRICNTRVITVNPNA